MTKEQLQKQLEEMTAKVSELEENAEVNGDMYHDLDKGYDRLHRRIEELLVDRAYSEGQLEVFKRYSGVYPEVIPTREEYLRAYKDIISTNADWRSISHASESDLPF
jgi:chromosome segregation ATPase